MYETARRLRRKQGVGQVIVEPNGQGRGGATNSDALVMASVSEYLGLDV